MSATAGPAEGERLAGRLGLRPGQVVQELGWDDDCDEELRRSVVALTGNELVDEPCCCGGATTTVTWWTRWSTR